MLGAQGDWVRHLVPSLCVLVLYLKGAYSVFEGLPCASMVKNPPAKQKTEVLSLGWEDPLRN